MQRLIAEDEVERVCAERGRAYVQRHAQRTSRFELTRGQREIEERPVGGLILELLDRLAARLALERIGELGRRRDGRIVAPLGRVRRPLARKNRQTAASDGRALLGALIGQLGLGVAEHAKRGLRHPQLDLVERRAPHVAQHERARGDLAKEKC